MVANSQDNHEDERDRRKQEGNQAKSDHKTPTTNERESSSRDDDSAELAGGRIEACDLNGNSRQPVGLELFDQNRNLNLDEIDKSQDEVASVANMHHLGSRAKQDKNLARKQLQAAATTTTTIRDDRELCDNGGNQASSRLACDRLRQDSTSPILSSISGTSDECTSGGTTSSSVAAIGNHNNEPPPTMPKPQYLNDDDDDQMSQVHLNMLDICTSRRNGHPLTSTMDRQPSAGHDNSNKLHECHHLLHDHHHHHHNHQQQQPPGNTKDPIMINTNDRRVCLIGRLGRSVSLFPRVLSRQINLNRRQQQQQQATTTYTTSDDCTIIIANNDECGGSSTNKRSFSLQTTQMQLNDTTTNNSTNNNNTSYNITNCTNNLSQAAPATVAGVGGTITHVTRSKRKTAPLPRLVGKNGHVNLFLDNIDRRQYVRDLFTTMIDIKWRYNLMAAAFGFVFSWLLFACIWYVVLYLHQDLEHENDSTWSPCIVNVYSFPAALLFSIETQSTLGFGSRIISVECPGAIVIFCIQLIFGVVVECLIVGMVFAKLSRPAKRSQTIMYSKYATVCLRDGQMCLMFRVGDVRSKSHVIGATIRASLVSQKISAEGETIPFYHQLLECRIDDSNSSLLLIWPVTIVHLINESSPFFKLNAQQLAKSKFEIITVLEGTVESTGQSIQVRSSYLPSEIKWGYRFEPIVSTHGYGKNAQTIIDYNKFNQVIRVDTPSCSPMDYYCLKQQQHDHNTTDTSSISSSNNNNNNNKQANVLNQDQIHLHRQQQQHGLSVTASLSSPDCLLMLDPIART